MLKYRFYKPWNDQKWYCIGQAPSTGSGGTFYSPHRKHAAVFTEADWQTWGKAEGLEREVVEDRGCILSKVEGMTGKQVGLPGIGE